MHMPSTPMSRLTSWDNLAEIFGSIKTIEFVSGGGGCFNCGFSQFKRALACDRLTVGDRQKAYIKYRHLSALYAHICTCW